MAQSTLFQFLRKRWNVIIGFFVSLGCLYWVANSAEWNAVFDKAATVDYSYLLLAFATMSLGYFVRALRWRLFFKDNTHTLPTYYKPLIVGFFANNILPARMGEIVRAQYGRKYVGHSRSFMLGTIVGERIADAVTISIIFLLVYSSTANETEILSMKPVYIVAFAFCLIGLLLSLVLIKTNFIFRLLDSIVRFLRFRSVAFAITKLKKLIEGLQPLKEAKILLGVSIFSLTVWSIELLSYYFVSFAFNEIFDWKLLALFLAAVNFSSLIPAAPGAIGVIEAFASIALSKVGLDYETALAIVASQHLTQIIAVGIPGSFYFFHGMGGKIILEEETV